MNYRDSYECKKCKELTKWGDQFCWNCGTRISHSTANILKIHKGFSVLYQCSLCRSQKVDADDYYCRQCGAQFRQHTDVEVTNND